LDTTLTWLGRNDLASKLTYSSSHIVGLGLRGQNPHDTKCWLYYPEDDCPFYRCTVFSHYAKKNAPDASVRLPTLRLGDPSLTVPDASPREGPYWSLMFEVSENKTFKPVNLDTIVEVSKRVTVFVCLSVRPSVRTCFVYVCVRLYVRPCLIFYVFPV
jgi:hypothetical protein